MATDRRALGIIFLTVFIDLLGFGIVLPLLPRYGKAFGAGEATLGLLMASFSAMQFLFAPLWGRISDKVGRRPVLMLGLLGSTGSYALFGYATSLGGEGMLLGLGTMAWLFISRIGAGIAGATISTAQAYIADSTDASSRGKGMAIIGAAFGAGFIFGPLIGAAFVSADMESHPSPMPGYVAAGLSGLAFLSAVFVLPESLKKTDHPGVAANVGWANLQGFTRVFSQRGLAMVLLTIFLTTVAFAQFESTLSLLTRHLQLPDRQNFYIFSYIGLILTVAQGTLVRRLIPKLGEFRMALLGTILMTLGLFLLGVTGKMQSVWMLYAFLPPTVIGFSATTPSLTSLLSLRTREDEQGQTLGVGQSISALARILGPVTGLPLQGVSAATPYWVAGGLMALSILLVFTLREPAAPPADRETPTKTTAAH